MTKRTQATRVHGHLVDAETGEEREVLGELNVTTDSPTRREARGERRHKVYALVDTVNAMARIELTMQESRVFWIIMGAVNPNTGEATITGSAIADEMGVPASGVYRILKSLRDRNIIIAKKGYRFVVNPWIAFYGSSVDWETTTPDFPEPEWSRP